VALDEGIAFKERQSVATLVGPSLPQAYDFACARLFKAAHESCVMVEVILQKAPRRLGRLNVARVVHLTLPFVHYLTRRMQNLTLAATAKSGFVWSRKEAH